MRTRARDFRARRQHGASLIEVMVAVLVMAVGLLGIAALQTVALRNSQSSMERTQAVIQSYSILDAMRANVSAARAGSYDRGRTCAPVAGAGQVEADLNLWIGALGQTVGSSACGAIDCDGDNVCTVTVSWDESRGTAGAAAMSIETTSRL
ncbi:type IV pilus modification protein PilV [Lysobacter alkalisoli]|uniref:Type IV pilus modification protein PilV n=1 Tax=Marilutibacter alkalisoli TaxID=2591633 RepID=A0A514BWF0_9GAMM|nr:type IV pilus modification protein PilV [Lysobacter alkalisoli]